MRPLRQKAPLLVGRIAGTKLSSLIAAALSIDIADLMKISWIGLDCVTLRQVGSRCVPQRSRL
jgi:hypothetical protein